MLITGMRYGSKLLEHVGSAAEVLGPDAGEAEIR